MRKITRIIVCIVVIVVIAIFSGCSTSTKDTVAGEFSENLEADNFVEEKYTEYKGAFLYESNLEENVVLNITVYENGKIHFDDNARYGWTSTSPNGNTTYTRSGDDLIIEDSKRFEKLTYCDYKGVQTISIPSNCNYKDYNYLVFPVGTDETIINEYLKERTETVESQFIGKFVNVKSQLSNEPIIDYLEFKNDKITFLYHKDDLNGSEYLCSSKYTFIPSPNKELGYIVEFDNKEFNEFPQSSLAQMYINTEGNVEVENFVAREFIKEN